MTMSVKSNQKDNQEEAVSGFLFLYGYTDSEQAIVSHVLERHLPPVVKMGYNFWLIYKLYSLVGGNGSEQYVARRMHWSTIRSISAPTAAELAGKLELHYLDATDPEALSDLEFQKAEQIVTSKETKPDR